MTHPLQRSQHRRIRAPAVKAIKKVQLLRIGSRLRAFQRAIDKVRTLPLTPPKGGSKSKFVIFVNKNQFTSNKLCYKVLCVKTGSDKVVAEPFPYLKTNDAYMLAVYVTFRT